MPKHRPTFWRLPWLLAATTVMACSGGAPQTAADTPAQRQPPLSPAEAARCSGHDGLAPVDQACRSDAECLPAVTDSCAFIALNERALATPAITRHLCTFVGNGHAVPVGPLSPGPCACSVPGIGARCYGGCCQVHILPNGAWE
jgi:hypothetical protein